MKVQLFPNYSNRNNYLRNKKHPFPLRAATECNKITSKKEFPLRDNHDA